MKNFNYSIQVVNLSELKLYQASKHVNLSEQNNSSGAQHHMSMLNKRCLHSVV